MPPDERTPDGHGQHSYRQRPVQVAVALPFAATALLVVGAVTSGTNGSFTRLDVLIACLAVVGTTLLFAEAITAPPLLVVAWLVVDGFSHRPYAQLQAPNDASLRAAGLLVAVAVLALTIGYAMRKPYSRSGQRWTTLDVVTAERRLPGVSRTRSLVALLVATAALPLITLVLVSLRSHLSFADDLLVYLVAVVGITVIGGFLPAVAAAVASSLLLNWFFTPPLHTWTIDAPQNLLALLLFVTFAICVSSVVHLAAQRTAESRASNADATALLTLAQTVLEGQDTVDAVLQQFSSAHGLAAELTERVGSTDVRVASAGDMGSALPLETVIPRPGLKLTVAIPAAGEPPDLPSRRVLAGYAAQLAAALDRQRLRVQAAQAEALAEGNRMRTALLAAVSHDLRTPLSSIKAGVSTLRQTDVEWSEQDEAELLATIEEGADRLDYLIGNLLDMSRLTTGSLSPFLRATAIDEVTVLAMQGLPGSAEVELDVPDDLPLAAADPGLLERALANLIGNALRFSPPESPPTVTGQTSRELISISVIDHGPGVAAQDQDRIFEPFQRLGDQAAGSGVGLGLAVARGFVEAMGGHLTATATPGGGLTMTVELRAWNPRRQDVSLDRGTSRR
jgi:two-component system sensor histidine kinase KdpD